MKRGREPAKIRRDIAEAQKADVTGTPAFFFACTDPKNSQVKTVTRLTAARPSAVFKATINKLLTGK
jgi:predicted DsbA family dithiol-disulfide isomerase